MIEGPRWGVASRNKFVVEEEVAHDDDDDDVGASKTRDAFVVNDCCNTWWREKAPL
jgi:hypothetical protein